MLPIYVGWKCFPQNKGTVSSVLMFSNGVGAIISSILTTMIVNPTNAAPSVSVQHENTTQLYYSADIAMRVPFMFLCLSFLDILATLIAIYLIYTPEKMS